MSSVNGGGVDCSLEGSIAFVAGAGLAGTLFFGWGGLVTGYLALGYLKKYCF
jgi:hypothetical protein